MTDTLELTREEAIKKLLGESDKSINNDIFDSYGNYKFPSDITVDQPNIAFGISDDILSIIKK